MTKTRKTLAEITKAISRLGKIGKEPDVDSSVGATKRSQSLPVKRPRKR
jgi:hypothetical protein